MQTKESILKYEAITDAEVLAAMEQSIRQVRKNLPLFAGEFPSACSRHNYYEHTANDDWTDGFWTGELWLSYEATGEACFQEAAVEHVKSFHQRIIDRVVVDHHDMGFLYTPSCVAAYKLAEDPEVRALAKKAALMAADNLMGRFQEKGGFFQAWGPLGAKDNYRLIIDCLLNLPLLFWASRVTGDARYETYANRHIRTALSCLIRKDYSTFHTFFFDPETGNPVKGVTAQGHRDDSIWARGQAWGVYGCALSYAYQREETYIELFEKLAATYVNGLPEDLIPYWDFDFTDGSPEPRDASSAAIVACGMLEMSKYLDEERAAYYTGVARRLMKALTDRCLYRESDRTDGILLHSTYCQGLQPDGSLQDGADECTLWGDYFYMEALTRLKGNWDACYWIED